MSIAGEHRKADRVPGALRSGTTDSRSWALYERDVTDRSASDRNRLFVDHLAGVAVFDDRILYVDLTETSNESTLDPATADRVAHNTEQSRNGVTVYSAGASKADPDAGCLDEDMLIILAVGVVAWAATDDIHRIDGYQVTALPLVDWHSTEHIRSVLFAPGLTPLQSLMILFAAADLPALSLELVAAAASARIDSVLTERPSDVDDAVGLLSFDASRLVFPVTFDHGGTVRDPTGAMTDTVWWYLYRIAEIFFASLPDTDVSARTTIFMRDGSNTLSPACQKKPTLLSFTGGGKPDDFEFFTGPLSAVAKPFDATDLPTVVAENLFRLLNDFYYYRIVSFSYSMENDLAVLAEHPELPIPVIAFDSQVAFVPVPVGFFAHLERSLNGGSTPDSGVWLASAGHGGKGNMGLPILTSVSTTPLLEFGSDNVFDYMNRHAVGELLGRAAEKLGHTGDEAVVWVQEQTLLLSCLSFTCDQDEAVPGWSDLICSSMEESVLVAHYVTVLTLIHDFYENIAEMESTPLDWYLRLNGFETSWEQESARTRELLDGEFWVEP